MTPREITQAANDFRIWRLANMVGWDCTTSELARELGLSPTTVGRTLKRRGWRVKGFGRDNAGDFTGRFPVDMLLRRSVNSKGHQ